MKIINVAGARPNFMKIAPLAAAFANFARIESILVHTGQHYDERMSQTFFRQLAIGQPDVNLGVGSSSHASQTAAIMKAFEPVVLRHKPTAVLVVGDVNSTVACALVAAKLGVKVIHVEAGLRSFDKSMPEEINRILTDAISDFLFCTEKSAVENLRREGATDEKIFLVGNVMIDTLLAWKPKAEGSRILDSLNLDGQPYAVLTLHRPGNVDDAEVFSRLLDAIEVIQRDMPVIFPAHPRTRKDIVGLPLRRRIEGMANLRVIEPAGYLDFIKLMSRAAVVLTDSGGIQEETTVLKVPCLTLRKNTERPVTCEVGSNVVVGTRPENIIAAYREAVSGRGRKPKRPPLWDGHAAERIAAILAERL